MSSAVYLVTSYTSIDISLQSFAHGCASKILGDGRVRGFRGARRLERSSGQLGGGGST